MKAVTNTTAVIIFGKQQDLISHNIEKSILSLTKLSKFTIISPFFHLNSNGVSLFIILVDTEIAESLFLYMCCCNFAHIDSFFDDILKTSSLYSHISDLNNYRLCGIQNSTPDEITMDWTNVRLSFLLITILEEFKKGLTLYTSKTSNKAVAVFQHWSKEFKGI